MILLYHFRTKQDFHEQYKQNNQGLYYETYYKILSSTNHYRTL